MILTKNNANERCRTCLRKLIKDENNPCNTENVAETVHRRFTHINSNKELQDMIDTYIHVQREVNFYKDELYPQYICLQCFKQLQAFQTFRTKAMDSAKKLYCVFSGNCNASEIELNDEGLEYKPDKGEHVTDFVQENIFTLLLKDSLMETEAIILNDAGSNNDFDNTDPDPFQNTQTQDNVRKPRGRKTKNKTDCISTSKITIRKHKKNSTFKESVSMKNNLELKLLNKSELADVKNLDCHEGYNCQNIPFHDPDYNSSANEVLSTHSDETKRKIDTRNNNCLHGNKGLSNLGYRVEESKLSSPLSNNNIDIETNSIGLIKTELDFGSTGSSDGDLNTDLDTLEKPIKVEKKKRHYILNSGRKKGLANRYKCDQCQHKFGHKLTLEAHVRKVHEGQKKAFKCQLCDKAYSFIGGLSTHIRDVHERKQDSYNCSMPGCDKKYSNFITLQRHVRFKHLNMEAPHQYVCEQCGATFKQSSNLRYHMKTRHPTEEDIKRKELLPKDRLECDECKKSFHSQYTLKYHKLRVHADEKKFECKICGRRVAKQFMLDSHMLVHSDQKMACKFCGREFVRKYQVEAHIRAVHQKLKPFQCPHCSESFASRKTLRHHIYIHTGEKPYVCDICGQAYRQPTCLKNHRKIHNKLGANNVTTAKPANINNIVQS